MPRSFFLFRDRLRGLESFGTRKEPLAENVQEAWDNIREEPAAETVVNAVADLDTAVTENTLFRYPLLECYGGMQLALGKHEEKCFLTW